MVGARLGADVVGARLGADVVGARLGAREGRAVCPAGDVVAALAKIRDEGAREIYVAHFVEDLVSQIVGEARVVDVLEACVVGDSAVAVAEDEDQDRGAGEAAEERRIEL